MQDSKFKMSVLLLSLPIFLVLPFTAIFDSIIYLVTRPSCLTCSTLPEFLKTASLSFFLLANTGYKFFKKS